MTHQTANPEEKKSSAPVIVGHCFPYSVNITATATSDAEVFCASALMFENGDVLVSEQFMNSAASDIALASVKFEHGVEFRAEDRSWNLVTSRPSVKDRLKAAVSAYGSACMKYGSLTQTDGNEGQALFNDMIQAFSNVDELIDLI